MRPELRCLGRTGEGRLTELKEELALVVRLNRPDSGCEQDMARLEKIAAKEFIDGAGEVRCYLSESEIESLRLRHGNLTPEEFEEMRDHVARTRTIVGQIPFTRNWLGFLKSPAPIMRCWTAAGIRMD